MSTPSEKNYGQWGSERQIRSTRPFAKTPTLYAQFAVDFSVVLRIIL